MNGWLVVGIIGIVAGIVILFLRNRKKGPFATGSMWGGAGKAGKDLIYQHDKYVQRSTEILDRLADARDNYANFTFFLKHLVSAAPHISPALARELVEAEDGMIGWAEKQFATEAVDESEKAKGKSKKVRG